MEPTRKPPPRPPRACEGVEMGLLSTNEPMNHRVNDAGVQEFNRNAAWGYRNIEMESQPEEHARRLVEEFEKKLPYRNQNPGTATYTSSDEESDLVNETALFTNDTKYDDPPKEADKVTNIGDAKQEFVNIKWKSTPDLRRAGLSDTSQRPKTILDEPVKVKTQRKESFLARVIKTRKSKNRLSELTVHEPNYTTVNIKRPLLCPGDGIFKAVLFKLTNDKFEARWCLLRNDFFLFYLDNEYRNCEECLSLETVLSAHLVEESKYDFKVGDSKLFYFGIVTATNRYVFGSRNKDIRNSWLHKIGECLNCKLIADLYEFEKIGWLYIREGIKGEWFGAWLLLANRTLYYITDSGNINILDLRKIRSIKLQEIADDDVLPHVMEEMPYLLVDYQRAHYSFRCWIFNDTESWYKRIQQANKNGSRLDEQQLNSYDVPVIVEKCINFLFLNGSMSKGIYRHNGQTSIVGEILNQFKKDAWSIHLTPDRYNEHDIATALKRFFRDLPEPLIPRKEQQLLSQIPYIVNETERVEKYRKVFCSCPKIHYSTMKVMFGHLHFIISQSDKNQMTISNIASIWGVTIMNTEAGTNESLVEEDYMRHILMADLINLHKRIFPENPKETKQKEAMEQVLDKISFQPNVNSVKNSGDFLIWIYIESKRGETYSVALNPNKTAYQVCSELSSRINLPAHLLVLEELVLNDSAIRPVHYSEKVLDIVLKWNDWDDIDKRNNCLILSTIDKYIAYASGNVTSVKGDTKFADSAMKKFKTHSFNILEGDIFCYKDVMHKQLSYNWKIEDIMWYFGCGDLKRNSPTKHTIVFISKNVKPRRSKTNPFVGNVLAFPDEGTKILWGNALMSSSYPQGLHPQP